MTAERAVAVRFGPLERRGVLLGLTGGQVAVLGVALVVAVLGEYIAGLPGLLVSAPVWALAGAAALVPVGGRPALDWTPVLAGWGLRRLTRTTTRRTVPGGVPGGLAVPGLPGLTLLAAPASGAALVLDRRTSTVTAVLRLDGAGLALAEPGAVEQRLAVWGRVLASWGTVPQLVRAQLLVRTVPGGAAPMRRWWAEQAVTDAPWAARVVAGLLADAEAGATRVESLLAVSLRVPGGRQAAGADVVGVVERQLAAVAETVTAAELRHGGWLDPQRLAAVLRRSFDPYSAGSRDEVAGLPPVAGMGLGEAWDRVRTDTGEHAVFWLREWPRSDVHPTFLQPLLLGGAHRALSLTVEPLPTVRAMRDIRRAKVEQAADAAQRARIGQVDGAANAAEAADVARREAELVAGHADLRFTGLLTVSAPTATELDAACAAVDTAAAQAMCELRRLVGQQAAGFLAGAVPLARSTA